ncbi:Uncharacterised protein [Mycobacteroides abscessus subsp. abscessus]|nr:Uncharacterised protein [Mycobacteroides abscessus subsp. abscessus]
MNSRHTRSLAHCLASSVWTWWLPKRSRRFSTRSVSKRRRSPPASLNRRNAGELRVVWETSLVRSRWRPCWYQNWQASASVC